jgi:alkanesulfonate monooxygenase SsuD/methylene tetrahydromethanopterin reductase-like flavin-dependent oxidoreductase (luciferase family)
MGRGIDVRLGLANGSGTQVAVRAERVKLAESLGYDSVGIAASLGSDAITVLTWIGPGATDV